MLNSLNYTLLFPVLMFSLALAAVPAGAEMSVSDRTMEDIKEAEASMQAQWKKESATQSRRFTGGGKYIDPTGIEWKYGVTQPAKAEPGKKYPVFLGNTGAALATSASQEKYPCFILTCYAPQAVISPKKGGGGYVTLPQYKSIIAAGYKAVVDKALAENPGMDPSRVYVEGASKFGATAWLAAYNYPDTFAAVISNVGGTDHCKALEVAKSKIGICMYYGVLDGGEADFKKAPYGRTAPYTYKVLTEAGYVPMYTKYTHGDHHEYGFSDSLKNPQWNDFTRLRTWLFEQKKPDAAWPIINSPSAAAATVGKPFTYTITASNQPKSFTAVMTLEHAETETGEVTKPERDLPKGLSLDARTGVISGKPAEAGGFFIRLNAINDKGAGITTLLLTVKDE